MKRACPFDANLLKMSKVHLMDYDVDMTALQKVHDTTLQKLRDGARISSTNITEMAAYLPPVRNKVKPVKQMDLTHYFKNSNDSAVFTFRAIPNSKSDSYAENDKCYFCDKKEPTNACIVCHEKYCSACSFMRYNAAEEMYVCLTCS